MPGGHAVGVWVGEGSGRAKACCSECARTGVGGLFLFVVWFGGSLEGVFFFFLIHVWKKSQIFYKGFFCLFFLQASDGHRVGFH